MNEVFIEAESFKKLGGWVIDQQSMEVIHSSHIRILLFRKAEATAYGL